MGCRNLTSFHATTPVVSAKGLAEHHDFPGLKGFGRIESTREINGVPTSQTRFFALSWLPTPDVLLETVRAHWAVENNLHWQLDVSLREDSARNRKDDGAANLAVLRRRALECIPIKLMRTQHGGGIARIPAG